MIKTKEELKEYINADNSWYKKGSGKSSVIERISSENNRILKKYLVFLRKSEYHLNNTNGCRYCMCKYLFRICWKDGSLTKKRK